MSEVTKFNTENVEMETPTAKAKVVLKGYVTARMQLATRGVFLRHTKLNMKATAGKTADQVKAMKDEDLTSFDDNITAEIINEINEITVKQMVISVNGETADVLELCLDLPPEDYEAIVAKCSEISGETSLDDATKKK